MEAQVLKRHTLKIHPHYFAAISDGLKTFEVRYNDRGYMPDDELELCEWIPQTSQFTGCKIIRTVSYILHGPIHGIEKGWCVMSLSQSR